MATIQDWSLNHQGAGRGVHTFGPDGLKVCRIALGCVSYGDTSRRFNQWSLDEESSPFLMQVADAVWRQRRMHVRCRRWKAPREIARKLEPFGLVLKGGRWYMVAQSDGQLRTYRISQLLDARPITEHFDRPNDFDLAAYWRAYLADFAVLRNREQASVRLSPRALHRLSEVMEPAVVQAVTVSGGGPDDEGWVHATIPIGSISHGHDELLRLAAKVEVLAPQAMRDRLTRTAVELARRYRNGPRS